MERREAASRRSGLHVGSSDDSSVEEIERDAAEATDLDDFLLLLDDDGSGDDSGHNGLSSVDPRSLALFADVATPEAPAVASNEEEEGKDEEGEASSDPSSDSYRGPGAIAAASTFAEGCLWLLRAFAKTEELSARCRAVATAVIERVNPADYTAWKLRWECSRALSSSSSSRPSSSSPSAPASSPSSPPPPPPSFLAEEARLCALVAARSGFKNYQLWNHRAKIIAEAVGEGGGGAGGGSDGTSKAAAIKRVAEGELSFASAALAADAKNYHAWSHRCLVAGLVRSVPLWESEREVAGGAIEEDPGSGSAWAHRAAAVGALFELLFRSSPSPSSASPVAASSSSGETEAMLEEEFSLAFRHARERPHGAGPAWAHARAVAGWKEAAAVAGAPSRPRHLPLPLASDPRYASLAAGVLEKHPGCVPALLLLHDAHALRAMWAAAAASEGGGGEEAAAAAAAAAAEGASSAEAAACRARLAEADPTRRGLWSSIGPLSL